jgi:hypothetical protein
VTLSGRVLPKEVIDYWPEVFGEVKLNVLPLRYLDVVLINFKDGKVWEIKITAKAKRDGWESLEKTLSDLVNSYESKIDNVNFKLDTVRVKKDIEKSTQHFLKKRKL